MLDKKYEGCVGSLLEGNPTRWPRYSSLWWKDLVKLGDFGVLNWFNSVVDRRVDNDLATRFWDDRWRGGKCFRLKYHRLYSISNDKEALVGEVGVFFGTYYGLELPLEKTTLCVGGGNFSKSYGGFGRYGWVSSGG